MTLIQRQNGTIYDLLDYGIRTRDVLISAPTPIHNFSEVEGANGVIDNGTTYGPREITCKYRAVAHDFEDFSLLRDEIFNLFRTEESFYLIEKRILGKRWLVKVANPYQIPQRNVYGNFDIDFIGIKGFSESVGTTQDIHRNGLRFGDGWSFGMGLSFDDDSHKYNHSGTEFRIFNAGNVPIHPFEQDLKITISNIRGSTSYFEMRNLTSKSIFRVNEPVTSDKTIVLDGPNITINSLNELRKTNRRFIELVPGWNNFSIYGARDANVEFDFRFYYL